jgi:hypothetical protein
MPQPLRVEITHGDQVKLIELADPREGFCRHFNEMGAEFGASARPVDSDLVQVVLSDPEIPGSNVERLGPPVSRQSAIVAMNLYNELARKFRQYDFLEMQIRDVESGKAVTHA